MNVSEMSDQEKSVMLAKLCGWLVTKTVNTPIGETEMIFWIAPETREHYLPYFPDEFTWEAQAAELAHNLYDPANMALAWLALNWALDHLTAPSHLFQLREMVGGMGLFALSPADAQRAWLDKILELAIAAGMVME